MNQEIWFIIVIYRPDTDVLRKLQKNLEGNRILIVDNSKNNLGFGGGANVGIQKALAKGAQWIVVLNQDVELTKGAVEKLCETLLSLEPSIAGPFAGRLDPKRWTSILPKIKHPPQHLEKNVGYVSGSCMAINKNVFEKTGLFYEPYFMYYEDVDFCVRAKKAGFLLTHVPLAGISHQETTSLHRGSFAHQYYLSRNHLLFVRQQAPFFVKIRETVRLPKTIWQHHRRQEDGAILGIRDYFLGHFGRLTKIV